MDTPALPPWCEEAGITDSNALIDYYEGNGYGEIHRATRAVSTNTERTLATGQSYDIFQRTEVDNVSKKGWAEAWLAWLQEPKLQVTTTILGAWMDSSPFLESNHTFSDTIESELQKISTSDLPSYIRYDDVEHAAFGISMQSLLLKYRKLKRQNQHRYIVAICDNGPFLIQKWDVEIARNLRAGVKISQKDVDEEGYLTKYKERSLLLRGLAKTYSGVATSGKFAAERPNQSNYPQNVLGEWIKESSNYCSALWDAELTKSKKVNTAAAKGNLTKIIHQLCRSDYEALSSDGQIPLWDQPDTEMGDGEANPSGGAATPGDSPEQGTGNAGNESSGKRSASAEPSEKKINTENLQTIAQGIKQGIPIIDLLAQSVGELWIKETRNDQNEQRFTTDPDLERIGEAGFTIVARRRQEHSGQLIIAIGPPRCKIYRLVPESKFQLPWDDPDDLFNLTNKSKRKAKTREVREKQLIVKAIV
ncbi:hypothetical protein Dda_7017 [Drechslerella dactyloides]|uniref:Uncharacterized protein n=1 Tax=Drechslerella dactyloides TaxID=74499 RepID=A0AAD6IXB6_DREDA|nr:hypothetical protein Dda_7017 [Drechslerella dactyloides]